MPVPLREDAVVLGQPQRQRLLLLRVPGQGRRHHASCMEKEALDFPGAVERLAGKAGITLRYTERNEGEGRKKRTRYVETMARAVDWYHERLLSGPDAGAGPGLPARARASTATSCASTASVGRPTPGTSCTRALRLDSELAEGTGLARLNSRGRLQRPLPGPHPVPHRRRPGRPDQLRRPHPPGWRGPRQPGQVQEHHRDAALQQVQGPLRARPGQDPHRVAGHRGDLRGLHRRHRVPPGGRAAGRRHVRHRAHRRPRRRCCTRFAAHRLVLAFDADSAGQAAAERFYRWEREHDLEVAVADLPAGAGPRRRGPRRPRAAGGGGRATRRRSSASGSTGRSPPADLASNEGRARTAERALEIVAEHPTELVRDQYLMDVASRCRVEPDAAAPPARAGAGPGPTTRAGRGRSRPGRPRRPVRTGRRPPRRTAPARRRPVVDRGWRTRPRPGRRQPSRRRRRRRAGHGGGARPSPAPLVVAAGGDGSPVAPALATARRSRCCATPCTIPGPSDAGCTSDCSTTTCTGGRSRRCSTPTPTPTP